MQTYDRHRPHQHRTSSMNFLPEVQFVEGGSSSSSMTSLTGSGHHRGPDLFEFLVESELHHYYGSLKSDLKVNTVAQLKYVDDEDLDHLGMTKPEMRRLKKFYHKYYPQNYLLRIKKKLIPKKDGDVGAGSRPSLVVPDHSSSLSSASSSVADRQSGKVPSKHIISADSISINKELGVGEFGVVQQGVWTNEDGNRIQVAIKRLSKERLQNNSMDFLKEASIMHSIDNEHIVRLYGVVLGANSLMLVTELAPLRSLLECLKEPVLRPSFPVISLCSFALQICDGMQYLENKRLIHRDLAARNILVFSKNKVKISDFGLSRALGVGKDYYQTNFNVNLKLPIAWCAPECINYLRFTSASDVWAYGVTLWEMFSYGFQPWAALTGQQILEAIDEPNFQRLEQPECCSKEYYNLMIKCWQHDPNKRPKFLEILSLLPECKPEQVQAATNYEDPAVGSAQNRREMLQYKTNDVITVLDKKPQVENACLWKGVLDGGKTGLFNPANTVAYLGTDIPSVKPNFVRTDGRSGLYSSSRRRLRPDMISRPKDDLKHTGHVGLDGAFFGDVAFLGDKYSQLPKQIVTPYKPQEDRSLMRTVSDVSDRAPLISSDSRNGSTSDTNWPDTSSNCVEKGGKCGTLTSPRRPSESPLTEHEYHEISDDDEDVTDDGKVDENYFQNKLDFGPSLMDEVFTALYCHNGDDFDEVASGKDERNNARNEIKEIVSKVSGSLVLGGGAASSSACPVNQEIAISGGGGGGKKNKKQATVKPISPSDAKAIDSAIAMANELANRNMRDMDGARSESDAAQDSPRTPSSPSKRKFSFRFTGKSSSNSNNGNSPRSEKRNFSQEAASIPDIQASLTEEAKEAYNSLVEKRTFESMSSLLDGGEHQQPLSQSPQHVETNPLRMLRSGVPVRPKIRGNKHSFGAGSRSVVSSSHHSQNDGIVGCHNHRLPLENGISNHSHSLENVRLVTGSTSGDLVTSTLPRSGCGFSGQFGVGGYRNGISKLGAEDIGLPDVGSIESVPHSNLLPLPPRDRSRPMAAHKPRQRKHPLIIPIGNTRNLIKPSLSASTSDINPLSPTDSCASTSSDLQSPSPLSPLQLVVSPSGSPPHSLTAPSSSSSVVLQTTTTADSIPAPVKPPRLRSLDDSFDGQIQADMDSLDDIPEEEAPVPPMYRNSDHVSCEDLMDFALDRPNVKRTQGRARGIDSDEVRIMQKVLLNEVTSDECVRALNETDWDVHKAIKYLKLQLLLSNQAINTDNCKQTLMSCGWDVQKAYNYLMATYGVTEDSTEV